VKTKGLSHGLQVKDEVMFASAAVRVNSKAFDNLEYWITFRVDHSLS
jgi:hypothetical protein